MVVSDVLSDLRVEYFASNLGEEAMKMALNTVHIEASLASNSRAKYFKSQTFPAETSSQSLVDVPLGNGQRSRNIEQTVRVEKSSSNIAIKASCVAELV